MICPRPSWRNATFFSPSLCTGCGEEARSQEEMDRAIRLALALAMHHRHFATKNGHGDKILQESWRRTWWQIYIMDAYYAAMKHISASMTCDVDITTELPCEESEYESGVCFPSY